MNMMNKKGAMSLGMLYPTVLTIIIVGILLGIGIYTLSEVSKGVSADNIVVVNESVTFENVTNAGAYVTTYDDCAARNFVITSVWNASDGLIPASNYTFSSTGLLTAVTGSPYTDVKANVSYSYTGTARQSTTDPCTTLTTSSTGVGNFASWIAVIIVVLAASIVLGIIISSFGRRSGV